MATTNANTAIRLLWALDAREVIARRITDRREELHLTQEEVATRGKIPLRTYQRWEAGEVMPRLPGLKKLAIALELPFSELQPPAPERVEERSTADQLREVLARLSRIEDLLTEHELADLEAEAQAEIPPTRSQSGRRAASGS